MFGAAQIEEPSGFFGMEDFATAVPARVAILGHWTSVWTAGTHIIARESAFHRDDLRDHWIPRRHGDRHHPTHPTKAFRGSSILPMENVMSVNSTVAAGSPPKALTLPEIHRRLQSCPPIPSLKSIQGGFAGVVGCRAALCRTDFRGYQTRPWADIASLEAGEFCSLRARPFRD